MNAKTRITRENLITRDFVIRSSFERFLPLPSLQILSRVLPAAPPFRFVSSRRLPGARSGDASRKSSGRLVPCPFFVQEDRWITSRVSGDPNITTGRCRARPESRARRRLGTAEPSRAEQARLKKARPRVAARGLTGEGELS